MSKLTKEDVKHLNWLHGRIINVYGESENVDFLHKFREVISKVEGVTKIDLTSKHDYILENTNGSNGDHWEKGAAIGTVYDTSKDPRNKHDSK